MMNLRCPVLPPHRLTEISPRGSSRGGVLPHAIATRVEIGNVTASLRFSLKNRRGCEGARGGRRGQEPVAASRGSAVTAAGSIVKMAAIDRASVSKLAAGDDRPRVALFPQIEANVDLYCRLPYAVEPDRVDLPRAGHRGTGGIREDHLRVLELHGLRA